MGCCLSTTDSGKSFAFGPQKHRRSLAGTEETRFDAARESRAPPPIDEETVKEVLSETPKPKHPPQSSPPPLFKHEPVLYRDQGKIAASEEEELPVFVSLKTKIDLEKIEQKVPSCNNNDGGGEVSELSEICSLSESMSGTTVTRDDDEDVHQRFVNRSPMNFRQNRDSSMGQRRDRVVGKSPSRITESSPGRRYGPNGAGSVRLVQSREPSPSQPMSRRWSRVSRPESNRRDPGESSGRRSRSPATRVTDGGGVNRANVGRSLSARKSGKYPCRTTIGPIESSSSGPIRRVAEEPHNEGNWPANESLDNPHVSLECFIFL